VQVIARARDGHTPAIVGTMDQQERRVVLESPSRRSSTAEFRAELSFAEEGMPAFYVASAQVPLPAGARLVVDYARWTADHPKALTAYVLHHGHRTPVAVKVTRG
jgi:hypothetical protein